MLGEGEGKFVVDYQIELVGIVMGLDRCDRKSEQTDLVLRLC